MGPPVLEWGPRTLGRSPHTASFDLFDKVSSELARERDAFLAGLGFS
jgi:hypothetical protein